MTNKDPFLVFVEKKAPLFSRRTKTELHFNVKFTKVNAGTEKFNREINVKPPISYRLHEKSDDSNSLRPRPHHDGQTHRPHPLFSESKIR